MGEKNKGGRPRKELSDDDFKRVIAMMRIQCTQEEICGVIGMNSDTLDARLKERGEGGFSECFKRHGDEGKASLRRMQWKAAEAGNPTMLVWLGKNMLDQTDKVVQDNTSSDGSMTPKPVDSALVSALVDKLTD